MPGPDGREPDDFEAYAVPDFEVSAEAYYDERTERLVNVLTLMLDSAEQDCIASRPRSCLGCGLDADGYSGTRRLEVRGKPYTMEGDLFPHCRACRSLVTARLKPLNRSARQWSADGAHFPGRGCEACGKLVLGTDRALQRCSRCKTVSYCSRECQVKHWTAHKPVCQPRPGQKPAAPPTEQG
ncbi:hypothetical protein DFJ74DRAFT_683845 [Hyaloraphidium curvatum]|nr:hypothetical protein DFJ74DRAFT_683845 [Hyaloraphidium curvatum]